MELTKSQIAKKYGVGKWMKGRKLSAETRKRMSLAFTGRKLSKEHKEKISKSRLGDKNWAKKPEVRKKMSLARKGVKLSEETKRKLSNSNSGEKSHFWKGGLTKKNKLIRRGIEYRLWREAVFARDNWTCQKCGKRDGSEIHPHHIKAFAKFQELRFAIDNGITLCKNCHRKLHKHKLNNK